MRVNAFEPTQAEIGDYNSIMANAYRRERERRAMYARKPVEKPKPQKQQKVVLVVQPTAVSVVPSPAPVITFDKMVLAEIDRRVAELIENQQLILRAKLDREIRAEMADRIHELRKEMTEKLEKRLKMADIARAVSRIFDVSTTDIYSARRTANIVWPRQIAMWYCKTYTLHSLPEIGRFFNGRDHTTVLYAVRKVSAAVACGSFVPLSKDDLIQQIKDFELPVSAALCAEAVG